MLQRALFFEAGFLPATPTLSCSAAFSPTGCLCFFEQIRERLVGEILKAAAAVANHSLDGFHV